MGSESTGIRVLRNSIYLILQPIILNVISIFVIGYIARKLGPSDFGIFNFIYIFTMLFYPIGIMGLDNVAIRELASLRDDKSRAQSYFSNILSLRIALALLTIIVICIFVNIIGYSDRIISAVYLGTAIIFFQLLGESLTDVFRSYERMEFVALASMVGGIILTILSVVILYLGYGLFEVIGVYAFGQLITALIAGYINNKKFINIRLHYDFKMWKALLLQGFPFFLMAAMWFLMERMDTLFISKVVSTEELGIYTTPLILITRLAVVPQSISNSLYPTISNFYAMGKKDETANIIRNYFKYIFIVATPFFILLSFYSDHIILIIFGEEYSKSGEIFKFLIWLIYLRLFGSVAFSILAAFRKQKLIVIAYVIALIFCLFVNIFLTINYGISGAVIAILSTQFVIALILFALVTKIIPNIFNLNLILKVCCLNTVITIFLVGIYRTNVIINDHSIIFTTVTNTIIVSMATLILYLGMLILFKLISMADLYKLKNLVSMKA